MRACSAVARERHRLEPEDLEGWNRALRDCAITLVGIFAAVFAILWVRDATLLTIILGFATGCFGLPAAIRLDERLRRTRPQQQESDFSERWSGLP